MEGSLAERYSECMGTLKCKGIWDKKKKVKKEISDGTGSCLGILLLGFWLGFFRGIVTVQLD